MSDLGSFWVKNTQQVVALANQRNTNLKLGWKRLCPSISICTSNRQFVLFWYFQPRRKTSNCADLWLKFFWHDLTSGFWDVFLDEVTLPMRWHIYWSIRPQKQRQSAVPRAARFQLAGCPTALSPFDSDSCSFVSFNLFLACLDVVHCSLAWKIAFSHICLITCDKNVAFFSDNQIKSYIFDFLNYIMHFIWQLNRSIK